MADKDLTGDGARAEDPDQLHAPLAEAIAGLSPADDVTRARHLRTALDAFAELSRTEFTSANDGVTAPTHPALRRLRLYRTLGAVAAAALVIFGFGVVLPLLSSTSGNDSDSTAMDSVAATLFVISEDAPAEMRAESAPSESAPGNSAPSNSAPGESGLSESAPAAGAPASVHRLFNLTGLCNYEIEELTYRESGIGSWVAFEIIENGATLLIVEAAEPEVTNLDEATAAIAAPRDSSEPPAVTLVLDPTSCALLRAERAGP
jgi:hypothetical protein